MNNQSNWMDNNEQHLAAAINWIHLRLEQLAHSAGENKPENPKNQSIETARQKILKLEHLDAPEATPPALILLSNALGLTEFDRHVLMLCVAMEFNTKTAALCANAQQELNKPYPTFALAFALFDNPDWNALSPQAPLRYWRLLEINQPGAQPLTGSALAADERIVNYLKGLNYLDDRLTPLLDSVHFDSLGVENIDETLPASQQKNVDSIIKQLQYSNDLGKIPVIELLGHESFSKRLIAEKVSRKLAVNLYSIAVKAIPSQTGDFETFSRLWQRESLLMPLALYIEVGTTDNTENSKLKRFLKRINGIVFLDLEDAKTDAIGNQFPVEVNKPTTEEQQQLWLENLQEKAKHQPQLLAEQFSFNHTEIKRLASSILDSSNESESTLDKQLWQACRIASRSGMEKLAKRIDVKANWEQIVLPPEQKALLQQITDQVNQRNRVYEDWGFRQQMNRGLGINALFSGESGTGKTMAAEVIANALNLDLYRIDLSGVVNKYIGETEKNLRKLFDTAEDSGAILFFDEADALFGKRSEVKDSHDRFANIEINYLLQRLESYKGLAILATNAKNALDKAFVRRLRFIVDFPFPNVELRKEIWQKVFPADTPVDENLDYERLANFNITGGNIHSVAMNSAFLAAQQKSPITMPLILNAARTEFIKLERPAKESDFRWLGKTVAK